MRFCPHCGAPLLAGAKFCVQCGQRLPARGQPAGKADAPRVGADLGFLSVFSGLVVAGALIAWVLVVREQRFDAAAGNPGVPAASQSAGASEAGLPAGHPKIQLPAQALKFIEALKREAEQKPHDLALWNQFGDVVFRAALLDPAFYEAAARAYTHVLKLEPDNLGALRGIGNVNYDRHHYDEATAAYEHYLKEKPDDPAVRTDLGTLYLYTGNPDQAVAQYNAALRVKPDFFEAYFNLGVAYNQLGHRAKAIAALNRALTLAPDDRARTQVRQLIAEANGSPPQPGAASPGLAMNLGAATVPQGSTGPDAASQPGARGNRRTSGGSPGSAPSGNSGAAPAPLKLAVVKVPSAALPSAAAVAGGPTALNGAATGGQPAPDTSASFRKATGSARAAIETSAGSAAAAGAQASDASAGNAAAGPVGAGNPEAGSVAVNDVTAGSAVTGESAAGAVDTGNAGAGSAAARPAATSAAGGPASSAQSSVASPNSFAGAIEEMVRELPVAGSRVKAVQWPSQLEAKVLLDNFPMDQMPPFAKEKFISDIKQGIGQAKKSWRVDQPFKLELADAGSGRVMETVTQ